MGYFYSQLFEVHKSPKSILNDEHEQIKERCDDEDIDAAIYS